ncbi:ATP-binding cassette sub- G member 1 [Chytridiales sp. JEL 0842]|nr:ATP-binding cassette sub- G member 1 [Chytridiales sp. JEL 0842]
MTTDTKESPVLNDEKEKEIMNNDASVIPVPLGEGERIKESMILLENMLPETDRMQIVFEDISYSIPITVKNEKAGLNPLNKNKKSEKMILKGVTGVFKPGRLTAVMGASGAGKTSLLQVLAGEARQGSLTGSIKVNNDEASVKIIKKISGFVFQDDVILATMTVREAITMSAILRLPNSIPEGEKMRLVDKMIKLLGLEKAANTIIGDSKNKGVSGGERKRCAMAMEMITNPSVLFLDEPTSGLDTFTAFSVVNTLRNLALTGRTVVATIHQPSSEVFQLFDDLLLMADGRIVYYGPADLSVEYFSKLGYICPDFTNPADFLFMSVLNTEGINTRSKESPTTATNGGAPPDSSNYATVKTNMRLENAQARIQSLIESWSTSTENQKVIESITTKNAYVQGIAHIPPKSKSTNLTQFTYLMSRASRNAVRNPLIIKAKFVQTVLIALIMGVLFTGTGNDFAFSGAQNRGGLLFFATVNSVMSSTIGVLSIFGEEKGVFAREFGAGYYAMPPYFASKVIVELPFHIIFPFLFSIIVYFMVGLQPIAYKFFLFSLFVVLSSASGFSLGIAIASSFSNLETALAMGPLILMPLMLFSGLFVNNNSIPAYFDWIKYISPMKYAFEAMYKNEFSGLTIACTVSPTPVSGDVCITASGFNEAFSILVCAFCLLGMVFGLMLVAYFALWRVVVSKGRAVEPQKADKGAAKA